MSRACLSSLTLSVCLLLSACGGSSEPAQPVATQAAPSPEDAFVSALEGDVPAYALRSDRQEWVDYGYEACETLDNGQTDEWVASALVSVRSLETAQADTVVAAAREHLCPEV